MSIDSVIFILPQRKDFFKTHQKCQNDVLHGNMNMDVSLNMRVYYIYLNCKTKLGYPWQCFSNWETIVKQIEKKIETQPVSMRTLEVLNKGKGISKPFS